MLASGSPATPARSCWRGSARSLDGNSVQRQSPVRAKPVLLPQEGRTLAGRAERPRLASPNRRRPVGARRARGAGRHAHKAGRLTRHSSWRSPRRPPLAIRLHGGWDLQALGRLGHLRERRSVRSAVRSVLRPALRSVLRAEGFLSGSPRGCSRGLRRGSRWGRLTPRCSHYGSLYSSHYGSHCTSHYGSHCDSRQRPSRPLAAYLFGVPKSLTSISRRGLARDQCSSVAAAKGRGIAPPPSASPWLC
jgi:hypothetical protein